MIVENKNAIVFTILGQAQSKANSRMAVDAAVRDITGMPVVGEDGQVKKRTAFVKSKEAQQFEKDMLAQIPTWARQELEGPVRVTLRLIYRTHLPDLDESIVLDCLQTQWVRSNRIDPKTKRREKYVAQKGVFKNDRQVREKHIYHGVDKANPRVEVCVEPMTPQQGDLLIAPMSAMDAPKPRDPNEVPF